MTFNILRKNLYEALILTLPEGVEDFMVNCDASISGLGEFLMQNGHMIAYASRLGSWVKGPIKRRVDLLW